MPAPSRRTRRSVLRAIAAFPPVVCCLAFCARLGTAEAAPKRSEDPKRVRPRRGDGLTPLEGPARGRALRLDELVEGAAPLLVVPIDLRDGTIRDASRLNQLRLLRLPADTLSDETARYAAAGVVAYSGVCSHTGCPVSEWNAEISRLVCPCHGSEFDPANRATVKSGPAPRRLAILPLRVEDGVLVVRSGFRGKVGFSLG